MALAMWIWRITFQITCDCGQGVCAMVGRYHTRFTDSGKVKRWTGYYITYCVGAWKEFILTFCYFRTFRESSLRMWGNTMIYVVIHILLRPGPLSVLRLQCGSTAWYIPCQLYCMELPSYNMSMSDYIGLYFTANSGCIMKQKLSLIFFIATRTMLHSMYWSQEDMSCSYSKQHVWSLSINPYIIMGRYCIWSCTQWWSRKAKYMYCMYACTGEVV